LGDLIEALWGNYQLIFSFLFWDGCERAMEVELHRIVLIFSTQKIYNVLPTMPGYSVAIAIKKTPYLL
jgi:hypothetical protein